MVRLVLASQSPARLKVLRAAGLDPEVIVSDVDEPAVLDRLQADGPVAAHAQVLALAVAKAEKVAAALDEGIVIGCDSMFELDGEVRGKPHDADQARRRLGEMRGREGVLHTGHAALNVGTGARCTTVASTRVTFGPMSDAEIDAYVATGEPLEVAGGFTIDGLGGWLVEHLDGDHTNVIGISLPSLRSLLDEVGLPLTDILAAHRAT